jgi:hypothetical protein
VTDALRPGEGNLLVITATQGGDLNAASSRNRTSLVPDLTGRVWLEALPAAWLENVVCDTDHAGHLELSWQAVGGADMACRLLDADRQVVWQATVPAAQGRCEARIACAKPWHPEHPYLYTLELELAVDPGIHDRYVDALRRVVEHTRHNDVGCIGGNIFTGMEAVAYAYPPGYPAAEDHVPCLGFIDRWRRPTPEYHHVRKLFSPVELHRVSDLTFRVENRSFSAPLADYRFTASSGALTLQDDRLHVTGELPLEISCRDAAGRLINRWRYTASAPEAPRPAVAIRVIEDATGIVVEQDNLRWRFRQDCLPVALRADGEQAAWDIGRLVVTPGANNPPSGLAANWQGTSLRNEDATVILAGKYAGAEGEYRYRFLADGRVAIAYRFRWTGTGIQAREIGVAVRIPRGCDRLRWDRDAEWSWYPADHIGRPIGEISPFPDPRALRAGPWELPTWPWAHDATPAGCRDFRSTKRFIHRFSLLAPGGAGLTFEADGDRHARAWIADDHAVAQCCHFTGRSAEGFIAGVDLAEMTIERGAALESEAVCRLT